MSNQAFFISLIIFHLSFFVVNNNKIWLLVFVLYGLFLFIKKIQYKEILFILFLLSLPFERGLRGWMIEVISPLFNLGYAGYSYYFGLSLKFFILPILVLILARERFFKTKNQKIKKFFLTDFFLISFLIFSLVSSIFANSDLLVLTGIFRIFYLVFLFFIARYFFIYKKIKEKIKYIFLAWLLFFGVLGSMQFFNGGLLGFYFEDSGAIAPFGYLTNESSFLFRVSGHTGHPTFFASWLAMIAVANLGFYLFSKSKKYEKNIYLFGLLLSFLALFATYSRSGWLSVLIVGFILFFYFYRKKKLKKAFLKSKYLLISGLAVAIFYSSYLLIRLDSFANVFSVGSGRGRIELFQESLTMIKNNFFTGVGLNHFTLEMSLQKTTDAWQYFLYPVHNTWFLFFAEMGILPFVFFILFVFSILKKIPKNKIKLGFYLASITFLINSQFHTLFSQDSSLDLFIIVLAYLDHK